MLNARKKDGIYKTFEFILTQNIHVWVYGKSTLNGSEFPQCVNQQNSSHGIYYCESLKEPKFDLKYPNTVKSTTMELF